MEPKRLDSVRPSVSNRGTYSIKIWLTNKVDTEEGIIFSDQ